MSDHFDKWWEKEGRIIYENVGIKSAITEYAQLLQQENKQLKEALEKIANDEISMELCDEFAQKVLEQMK